MDQHHSGVSCPRGPGEAILYLLRGSLPWRMLPPRFPPVSTVRRWFYLWRDNGLWRSLNYYLLMASRGAWQRGFTPRRGDQQPGRQDHGLRRATGL